MTSSPVGYFALVLHAHLPYVRHPDDPTVLEERWLYEAITGTYLPLLRVFEGLANDGVAFRCTLSLSPPLLTMLDDPLLRGRYTQHLDELIALAEKEIERTEPEPQYQRLAKFYRERFRDLRHTWRSHSGDLPSAFARLRSSGLELITATATHGFFPLFDRNWSAIRAQVVTAADLYESRFGRRPSGMWLGECGFVPGCDELLADLGIRYFIVDSHALLEADEDVVHGVYAPVYCPAGAAAFARDPESSEQVWSAKRGYPGDPHYRDFYRDIGFDLPMDYIGPHVHPAGLRLATGLKYHAITHDALHDKWVYDPQIARGKAGLHATHFRESLTRQLSGLAGDMDRPPVVVSPYDAELFGHWWFEGPIFLDDLFRQLHFDQDALSPITPAEYLDRHPTNQCVTPNASSWGAGGYSHQWLNETNAWTWRYLHSCAERMCELASRFSSTDDPLVRRALKQAARELLLAQSSDWTFILSTGTAVEYAERRIREHVSRFDDLHDQIVRGRVDEEALSRYEHLDDIFPDLDVSLYAG